MCRMCDGATLDEVLFHLDARIDRHGFTQVPVEGPQPWTYTIGLAAMGHPELVVAGIELRPATTIVDRLARRVVDGESFDVGEAVIEGGDSFELLPVHSWHLRRGLMNMWRTYYSALGGPRPPLAAIQVLAPPSWFCCEHETAQPRLDRPGPLRHGRPRGRT